MKTNLLFFLPICSFIFYATIATGETTRLLTGSYFIQSGPILSGKASDQFKRVYLRIDGNAAREIYRNIDGTEKRNLCYSGASHKVKFHRGLACMNNAGKFSCVMAINLKNAVVEEAFEC